MKTVSSIILILAFSCAFLFSQSAVRAERVKSPAVAADDATYKGEKVVKTKAQWRRLLTREQYIVTRESGTERPYTSRLLKSKAKGTYHCVSCNLALFSSAHKYDSQTGWPSFYQPIAASHVTEAEDRSSPMEVRTEVLCSRCNAHLGHVFTDGPQPTGLRYCMNGVALKFAPAGGKALAKSAARNSR